MELPSTWLPTSSILEQNWNTCLDPLFWTGENWLSNCHSGTLWSTTAHYWELLSPGILHDAFEGGWNGDQTWTQLIGHQSWSYIPQMLVESWYWPLHLMNQASGWGVRNCHVIGSCNVRTNVARIGVGRASKLWITILR